MIDSLEDLFLAGMKRELPDFVRPHAGFSWINLGSGKSPLENCRNLDFPRWDAETYQLPFYDESVGAIFAFHFFEHINNPVKMLVECERVLAPGCALSIVVPHYLGSMAYQDFDHKHYFCLDTWKCTFDQQFYDKGKAHEWRLRIGLNLVMGIAERNLALVTQLIKE